jgi:hypothetical protein
MSSRPLLYKPGSTRFIAILHPLGHSWSDPNPHAGLKYSLPLLNPLPFLSLKLNFGFCQIPTADDKGNGRLAEEISFFRTTRLRLSYKHPLHLLRNFHPWDSPHLSVYWLVYYWILMCYWFTIIYSLFAGRNLKIRQNSFSDHLLVNVQFLLCKI